MKFYEKIPDGMMESRMLSRSSFYELYGGLFFIGIYLGSMFIMATVLIIYYKQISEGCDDRERYQIMQKVGMSKKRSEAFHQKPGLKRILPAVGCSSDPCCSSL